MSEIIELEVPEETSTKSEIIIWLEHRVQQLLVRIEQQEFWRMLTHPETPPELVQAMMKEVYLEIVGYQPHVIEAAIASIGQMPRSMAPKMIRSMLYHQADEFDHGEMALRDYVNMGGEEESARSRPMSPPSFAVAGVWWMITQQRDPFAYLGALYLFEGLTPTVTGLVKDKLRRKGMLEDQLEYVEFHSTEDIKHARLVDHMISRSIEHSPTAQDSVRRGYEYFEQVYPIPVWQLAYERAVSSV